MRYLRFLCLILFIIAYTIIFSPITTYLSWFSFVELMINVNTVFAIVIIGIIYGSITYLFIFGILWVKYNPIIGFSAFTFIVIIILAIIFINITADSSNNQTQNLNFITKGNFTANSTNI